MTTVHSSVNSSSRIYYISSPHSSGCPRLEVRGRGMNQTDSSRRSRNYLGCGFRKINSGGGVREAVTFPSLPLQRLLYPCHPTVRLTAQAQVAVEHPSPNSKSTGAPACTCTVASTEKVSLVRVTLISRTIFSSPPPYFRRGTLGGSNRFSNLGSPVAGALVWWTLFC